MYIKQYRIVRENKDIMLVRTLGLSAKTDSNFSDVKPEDYYYEAVSTAKKLGITGGTGKNMFNPEVSITRQDMMTLIFNAMRVAGKLNTTGAALDLDKFSDKGNIAPYAVESVAAMVKEGLVTGDGISINPAANATRAETAVLMYRIYNK